MSSKLKADELKRFDALVDAYLEVRDTIKKKQDMFVELVEQPLREMEESLAEELKTLLDASGAASVRTVKGTVSTITRYTAKLTDADIFMDFVRQHDAYELMDRRANSTACREYATKTGELPPGVAINAIRNISVRKPS